MVQNTRLLFRLSSSLLLALVVVSSNASNGDDGPQPSSTQMLGIFRRYPMLCWATALLVVLLTKPASGLLLYCMQCFPRGECLAVDHARSLTRHMCSTCGIHHVFVPRLTFAQEFVACDRTQVQCRSLQYKGPINRYPEACWSQFMVWTLVRRRLRRRSTSMSKSGPPVKRRLGSQRLQSLATRRSRLASWRITTSK